MQGLWKTKIGGWNAKGYKRKSASRKHLLKDKARFIRNLSYARLDKTKYIVLNKNIDSLYDEIFESRSIPHYRFCRNSNKEIQTMVYRQIRASIRTWIIKKDWDRERRNIDGERSMAWLID